MRILKTTPLLFVERIEPALAFWCERLGYAMTEAVHHGERLAFVRLRRDRDEVMLQALSGEWSDGPEMAEQAHRVGAALFHEVDSLDGVLEHMQGVQPLVGPRRNRNGKREIFFKDPAGFVQGFGEPPGLSGVP